MVFYPSLQFRNSSLSITIDHHPKYLRANPELAAGYLTVTMAENCETQLLKQALSDVNEALAPTKMTPEQVEKHQEKLNQIFSKMGDNAISDLTEWLEELGLKLIVTLTVEQKSDSELLSKAIAILKTLPPQRQQAISSLILVEIETDQTGNARVNMEILPKPEAQKIIANMS